MKSNLWEAALLDIAALLNGPKLQPYPELRDEWASMHCRTGSRNCVCNFCRADKANASVKVNWDASQQLRPHRQHEAPFGSLNAALELLLRWRQDGPSVRSTHEGMMSRCQEASRLGTDVQTTVRARDDLMIRRAGYAVDIENAMRRALSAQAERYHLKCEHWIAVMLSTVDPDQRVSVEDWGRELKLDPRDVKHLIAEGRRLCTIELAAVGLIPMPRDRAGLHEAIHARQNEIENRSHSVSLR